MNLFRVVAVGAVLSLSTAMARAEDPVSWGPAAAALNTATGLALADCGAAAPGWHNALAHIRVQDRNLRLAADPLRGWHDALAGKRVQDRTLVLAAAEGWHDALARKRAQDRALVLAVAQEAACGTAKG
jgi:hypothetical protein